MARNLKRQIAQIEVIKSMVDDKCEHGIIQHRIGNMPDYAHGYSMDDQARFLQVLKRFPEMFEHKYVEMCLKNFKEAGDRDDGLINNFKKKVDGKWGWIKGKEHELLDVLGRSLWALAEHSRKDILKKNGQKYIECVLGTDEAGELFYHHLSAAENIIVERGSPHSVAFTLLACSEILKNVGIDDKKKIERVKDLATHLTQKMFNWYNKHSRSRLDNEWIWPDSKITYCAARIPYAMIVAGEALNYPEARDKGRASLNFLIRACLEDDTFVPVGNNGWYERGKEKARYEQQSVEAAVMAEACFVAAKMFSSTAYDLEGKLAMNWFDGNNSRRARMIAEDGGVYDAVTEESDADTGLYCNTNMGAESILTYVLAKSHLVRKKKPYIPSSSFFRD